MNFLKYHIQDNALFIGAEEENGDFETAVIDPSTERFFRVSAVLSADDITLTDKATPDWAIANRNNADYESELKKRQAHVVTTNPALYNLVAREFQYDAQDASRANAIETSSSAVIHLIDKPLQIEYWKIDNWELWLLR